jgi:hypothetical protein
MARLTEDAQWIMLMALVVCVALFFLAYLINESVLVGKTTAESALDFPKSDIRDIRSEIVRWNELGRNASKLTDIETFSMNNKNAIVKITLNPTNMTIHYNNGLLLHDEKIPL